ncbi:MAG: thiamine phosphate synthase [Planctomycetaceae bacterium]
MPSSFPQTTTPAADRILRRCRMLSAGRPVGEWAENLVLCLVLDESLAAGCLAGFGIDQETIQTGILGQRLAATSGRVDEQSVVLPAINSAKWSTAASDETDSVVNDPALISTLLDRAAAIARKSPDTEGISSEHLLMAVTQCDDPVAGQLAELGATKSAVEKHFGVASTTVREVIAVSEQLNFPADSGADFDADSGSLTSRVDRSAVFRLLDANLNRAREGLRVLEDYARFVLNSGNATRTLKELRHGLVDAEKQLRSQVTAADEPEIIRHRNTAADVGTQIMTAGERHRTGADDVVVANARRVQEALRSLEEFGKTISPSFAETMKQLRYDAYEAERLLRPAATGASSSLAMHSPNGGTDRDSTARDRHRRLQTSRVCVLLTEQFCRRPWRTVADEILEAGVDIIQLREKHLCDRELLARARWLRDATRETRCLLIVNDRIDIAAASDADGVHVGQEELAPKDARRILHTPQLVGVSTHRIDEAEAAAADGADYLGVGPIFPSSTKSFRDFPGLDYLRAAVSSVSVPCFAIGGITLNNLDQIIAAGASRVAVSSAVLSSDAPGDVVREMASRIRETGASPE